MKKAKAYKVKISNNVIRRLPRYLRRLDELLEHGINRISSAELGRQMGITPSQIRQDLSSFGEFGLQGYGYNVTELRTEIRGILGADQGYTAVLIGVGNIGQALLSNFDFASCGIEMLAAFDIRSERIGRKFNGVLVHNLDELAEFLRDNAVDVAVLAVPNKAAISITNTLYANGVEAVWNFTNMDVAGPDSELLVENLHFSDSLYTLSYYLTQRRAERRLEKYKTLGVEQRVSSAG